LWLPAPAAGDGRVYCEPIDRLRVPVRVEADVADVALRPLGDRLRDRVRAARRVLADHDRQRADIEHLVDLLLDGRLCPEDVVDGRPVEDLRRNRGIPEIDEL